MITWNVNSLRALMRKDALALQKLVEAYEPEVLCLQETKLQERHEGLFADAIEGYTGVFNSSKTKLGYGGTATFCRKQPHFVGIQTGHDIGDEEGRVVETTFSGVVVVNVYTMNAGMGLKRIGERVRWDSAFRRYVRGLRKEGRAVVIVGDLNVARGTLDVFDEKVVEGRAGFSETEREGFEMFLETTGMVDAFRMIRPQEKMFTYWDYRTRGRERGEGWRIDYALVSEDMLRAVREVRVLDDIFGSDHCPVVIDLAPGFF